MKSASSTPLRTAGDFHVHEDRALAELAVADDHVEIVVALAGLNRDHIGQHIDVVLLDAEPDRGRTVQTEIHPAVPHDVVAGESGEETRESAISLRRRERTVAIVHERGLRSLPIGPAEDVGSEVRL